MNNRTPRILASFVTLGLGAAAGAQCTPEWLPTPSIPGVTGDGPVSCATTWDPDGAGPLEPVLVIGGGFEAAGNVITPGLAAWNGKEWTGLGPLGARVLAVYNGDLIAAGQFTQAPGGVPAQGIARFDGTSWHALGAGLNQQVFALAVYNGELIAAGTFTDAGGGTADNIARWTGTTWLPLGSGVNDAALALTIHNGDLVVGGWFTSAGGQAADKVARWNGFTWTPVNDPANVVVVEAMHVYQGEIIAAGTMLIPGASGFTMVARWTGTAWQELGGDTNDHIFEFCEYQGDLICGGIFTNAGGVSAFHLAKWNGSFWSPVFPMSGVGALIEYQGDLIVGGRGTKPNETPMSLVLRWDGVSAGQLGTGTNGAFLDFETFGGDLYAAGEFSTIGDVFAPGIARRVQGEWQAVGGAGGAEVGVVHDLVVFEDALIAAGSFGAARWDGASWHPFGFDTVDGMLVHEGSLYAALGLTGPNSVVRWNPATTSWDAVGSFPEQVFVGALTVHNGELIAGGFGNAANVWRLDGDQWLPVGGWMGFGAVHAFAVYNGELIAGGFIPGSFTNILNGLARFNGTDWVALGGGMHQNNSEWSLFVFDLLVHDGALLAAGGFTHAGSSFIEASNIASWNGSQWSALGAGTTDAAICLHPHGGEVHVGGWFHKAGGKPAGHWARWGCDVGGCYPDCNLDGALTVADFGCFQTKFVAGDPYADCNADGSHTVADFGCFQTNFVVGCP